MPHAVQAEVCAPLGPATQRRWGCTGGAPFEAEPAGLAQPAFTRRRERLVGRAAMLGLAAGWAGEVGAGCHCRPSKTAFPWGRQVQAPLQRPLYRAH